MLLGDPVGIPTPVGISLADSFPHWGRENQGKILWCHLFHEAVCVPAFTYTNGYTGDNLPTI